MTPEQVAERKARRVLDCASWRNDGWLPFRGSMATARRLEARGLLKECGFSVMPPHTLFVITEAGREFLAALNK